MKKIIYYLGATTLVLVAATVVTIVNAASAPKSSNGNKIECFDGVTDTAENPGYGPYTGTCRLVSPGSAILDTTDTDTDPNNSYAGVYVQNTNLDGKLIGDVNKLAFSYSGSGATGGSPRISIPIDEDGDGTTEAYAFIDTVGCNDGNSSMGTLDAISDTTCSVAYGEVYPNWAAFVEDYPDYRIASDALSFIIIDQPGDFTISNVQLGKGPARTAK